MAFTPKKRLILSCLYLGLMFLVAGTVYHYLQRFSGSVFLLPGAPESLAFRPSEGAFRPGIAQRGVAPELLLFDNPRSIQALRPDQNYDGIVLPFALRLDRVEVLKDRPPHRVIEIDGPGEKGKHTVTPGVRISVGDEYLEVDSIGLWEGLVRVSRGEPMAAVEVPGADASLKFLDSGRSHILQPDLAVRFTWYEREAEARAALPTRLDEVAGARWGVRDRGAIQWFENFIPGTGLVVEDGAKVTLAEWDRAEGSVTLQIARGPGTETVRVKANAAGPEDRYLYDDPAGTGRVLYLHAWREDGAIARLMHHDGAVEEFEMGIGSGGGPVVLRQIMAEAVAVPGGKIRAAQVRLGKHRVALREGLAETVGEYRLLYREEPVPPEARYHIAALDPAGAILETRTVEAGQKKQIGAWVIALSPENPFAPRGVALTVERRPGGVGQIVGLALFLLGSFGFVVARFAPRY